MGADVVRVRLKYHEKVNLPDPTLKLGWVHAVTKDAVASCGPAERRDHGYLVPRARYDALVLKYEVRHHGEGVAASSSKRYYDWHRGRNTNSCCTSTPCTELAVPAIEQSIISALNRWAVLAGCSRKHCLAWSSPPREVLHYAGEQIEG